VDKKAIKTIALNSLFGILVSAGLCKALTANKRLLHVGKKLVIIQVYRVEIFEAIDWGFATASCDNTIGPSCLSDEVLE
jgi:hypothetical protein